MDAATSGQLVYILPGTYSVTGDLVVPTGVTIRGIESKVVNLYMTATSNTHMISLQSGSEVQDITMYMDTSGYDGVGIL